MNKKNAAKGKRGKCSSYISDTIKVLRPVHILWHPSVQSIQSIQCNPMLCSVVHEVFFGPWGLGDTVTDGYGYGYGYG
jgi:hypothetical protein